MKDGVEKRIFKRLETGVPVDLELGSQALQTTTANISCGGMFLKMDSSYVADYQELQLLIHLPNREKPVKLLGEIRRSDQEGVAVKFQGLYNDNILAIETFIKSNLN